jgi:hypothetical protein
VTSSMWTPRTSASTAPLSWSNGGASSGRHPTCGSHPPPRGAGTPKDCPSPTTATSSSIAPSTKHPSGTVAAERRATVVAGTLALTSAWTHHLGTGLRLLDHLSWWWLVAAVVFEAAALALVGLLQRRLLGAEDLNIPAVDGPGHPRSQKRLVASAGIAQKSAHQYGNIKFGSACRRIWGSRRC